MQIWRLFALATASATQVDIRSARSASSGLALIPWPRHVELSGGDDLVLHAGDAVRVSAPTMGHLSLLSEHVLSKAKLKVDTQVGLPRIVLDLQEASPKERYALSVGPREVRISGAAHGLFNGLMTLRQLMTEGEAGEWRLPRVEIRDEPAHEWRGLMLDVSRHFFNASDVKHLLRTMAFFKLNRFHWHLSDDQGWRVPSKSYPRLTQVGAWREGTQIGHSARQDHVRYGGFYSAEEVRSVVAFASRLYISVVPELDAPGHVATALAAYPQLGATATAVATAFGAQRSHLRRSAESETFLRKVIRDVARLVKSDAFHVGGDEVPSNGLRPEDAAAMTRSAVRAVQKLGRLAVVWDEALSVAPEGTAVMLWRSWLDRGRLLREAKEKGHPVIMCPMDRTYLDQFQSPNGQRDAFPAIGGFLDAKKVYELDLDGHGAKVLGGQGQIWSEYVEGLRNLDYKAWPRGAALAEATWSSQRPGFKDFQGRFQRLRPELRRLQVNFREADGHEALPKAPEAPTALVELQRSPAPHENWLKWLVEGPKQKARAPAGLRSRVRRRAQRTRL